MRIGIVGYGKMGRGIFSLLSDLGREVTVVLRDANKAKDQAKRLEKRLQRSVRSGLLTETELQQQRTNLIFSCELEDVCNCDLVIETIVEDFEVKTEILQRIESLVAPEALITTNTSSLSITDLGSRLDRPQRFCGLHFFHPVQLTTVIEIIRTEATSPQTLLTLQNVCRDLFHKRPLLVKDLPGSCLNVPLYFQLCESLYILEQGLALPSEIDAIALTLVRAVPCSSADIVGIPLVTAATERSLHAIPAAFSVPDLGRKLLKEGRIGRSANKGIYLYEEDRPVDDDPDYYRNPTQTHSRGGNGDEDALLERIIAPVYYSILLMAQLELGSLEDLCAGFADVVGATFDPLDRMKEHGSNGMREMFDRLAAELGPRYDVRPVEGVLALLDRGDGPVA